MQFTLDQQRVIDARKKNILVSAAAGSGKTAVLVERIIQMVIDEANPVDIDKLLIVTFTSAAASEMRERIVSAISKELLKHPESEHLQRQSALIHNAQITTIHSFCLSVIRNYFSEIGIDPGFRIADEGELKLLKKDTMDALLEECFEKKESDFIHFVETYAPQNYDATLEELIEKVYCFTMSFPMPEKFVDQCLDNLKNTDEENFLKSPAMDYLKNYIVHALEDCKKILEMALDIALTSDGPYLYEPNIKNDIEIISSLLESVCDHELFSQKITEVKFTRLPTKSDSSVSHYKKEIIKEIRDDVKTCLKDITDSFCFDDFQILMQHEKASSKALITLLELVKEYSYRLSEAKNEKNVIDFSDMEHYALKILVKEENGRYVPSQVAKDYQNDIVEIIVDEYQDSNLVQEFILEAVSGEKKGVYNRFMVGDVKQSIYRFRLARPELFMEKYNTYPQRKNSCEKIDLSMNFRSRKEVLDCTNLVFGQLMDASFGGITYDKEAALYYGANYYDMSKTCESELLLIERPGKADEDNSKQREAKVIAQKIKNLVGNEQIFDKNTGTYRNASYKDIVILLRTNKGWDDVFKEVLSEELIPCYTESKSGYFDTVEVRNVIEFLKIIDNPMQDIPLFGVMTSVFGGFTDEEMAIIKSVGNQEKLYACVKYYSENKEDELAEKIKEFVKMLTEYRNKSRYTSIRQLLQQLFIQFDYVAIVSAMKGGQQRKANVELLLQKAADYEKTSYFGAFHFVRYLQNLLEKEVDYGEADILDENADIVRIMSIHKSKGLEFPICFVAGLGKRINSKDISQILVTDSDMGIGTDYIDYEKRMRSETLKKNIIARKLLSDSFAEEIRILYVAFTRAREKLIISGIVPNIQKKIASLVKYTYWERTNLPFYKITSMGNMLDYVLLAFARSKSMESIYKLFDLNIEAKLDKYIPMGTDTITKVQVLDGDNLPFIKLSKDVEEEYDRLVFEEKAREVEGSMMVQTLENKLHYRYPHKNLQNLYTKTTVSELKKAAFEQDDEAKPMFQEEKEKITLPKFMKQEEKVLGTTRGTAFHKVMEVFPFAEYADIENISESMLREEFMRQAESGKLPPEYIPLVSVKKIRTFLNSTLAKRMMKADQQGQLFKEQPFVYGLNANLLHPDFPETETVLIQGIIDVYFEEDGQIVLMDYKTDVVEDEEELVKRYKVQLDYYGKVLEDVLSKPVKESMIYSFKLEKELKL